MDGLYLWWPSSNISAPTFPKMYDLTQSMFKPESILQLALLGRYPNAYFGHKTLIKKPKVQYTNIWFYRSAYMGVQVGALPNNCTPSYANFTLLDMCKNYESHNFNSITDATWPAYIHKTNWDRTWFGLNLDKYIARRQLRWLGHVSRMPFDRLPWRLLSSWVLATLQETEATGCPGETLGNPMIKALKTFDIDPKHWPAMLAVNRTTTSSKLAP